jgi:presenilin-like A22 family membrane protease
MMFDVVLPTVLFLVTAATLYVHSKYEMRGESIFEERKLDYRYAVIMVVATGIMASVLLLIPDKAVMIFFMSTYSLLLFLFTYLVAPKWYLSFLPPALFIAIYFSPYWMFNVFGVYWIFNVFGIVFAILVSVLLGSLFEWKTTAVFVALITIIDVVQVLVTGHMVESGRILVELRLPVMVILPTFPYMGGLFALGLGDFFLSGLLSIQTAQKYGRKLGLASAMAIAVVFLVFQTVLLNFNVQAFPATVIVISGWLITLATQYLYQSNRLKHG